ncbi:MAG: hydrogenase 3 maturation endopeptidase HyCI [Thermoanaerobaculaceae bacterium]|nr:hydrogenase 3 maturation endopeptidase HyCI [Thermoanaerobaculaceae bacterium]
MSLRAELAELLSGAVTIVGIGNPVRGDDAFGSLLARLLAGRVRALVIDAEDVPENFVLAAITASPDAVLFLDAIDLGEAPGTAALVSARELSSYMASTHRMPLSMLMEIVRRETGARVAVLAVQPGHTELAMPPSPEVAASAASLAELLIDVLPSGRVAPCGPSGAERSASC